MSIDLTRLYNAYHAEMLAMGLLAPEITARRLAVAFGGTYFLTLAVGEPVNLPMLPHIPTAHQSYVQTWMGTLRARITTAIEEADLDADW